MNTNAAALAAEIPPYFARTLRMGLTAQDAMTAAVLLWKQDEASDFDRRWNITHILADALTGTYDEFRAEAAR